MIHNFRNTIRRLIRDWVRNNVETTLPGVVVDISTYQETQQIAVVQPLLNLVFEDNIAVEMPYLYNVPVELTGTKESLFSVPIKVGDTVVLKFSKRSLDTLKDQAEALAHNPEDTAWFDTKDAVAFPTVLNMPANLGPHPDHVEIRHKDILVSYQDDGTIAVANANALLNIAPDGILTYTSGPVSILVDPNADSANINVENITLTGNLTVTKNLTVQGDTSLTSTVTSNSKDIGDQHTHGGVTSGGASTGIVD